MQYCSEVAVDCTHLTKKGKEKTKDKEKDEDIGGVLVIYWLSDRVDYS